MQTSLFFTWVVLASNWFEKAPMRMMYLMLKGRGRWAQVLKVHVGVAALIHQFYANLYIRRETKTFHWLLQGKPLSVSYECFAQILGLGEEDLGRPKIHGGEFPLDSEMAFMYDSMYGKVEFCTTHGMKPVYRMLN
jgi:hypothetical protein